MSNPGQERFAKLAQAAGQIMNGAVPLGKPNVVGRVIIGLTDDGKVGMISTDFDLSTASLLVSKMAASMISNVGVQVTIQAKPPGEG
jgi:CheY-specific phosphatase CheX